LQGWYAGKPVLTSGMVWAGKVHVVPVIYLLGVSLNVGIVAVLSAAVVFVNTRIND